MNDKIPPEKSIRQGSHVLVSGATGYTGRVLVKKLVEAGCDVRAIARPSSDLSALDTLPIEWFWGDVFDEPTVDKAMSGIEYVFHLAAAFREAKSTKQDYWNVHVKSTKLLARAALRQSSFQRFVHVSTIGVHGHVATPPADETYRFSPGDEYQNTKAEAETWLVDFALEEKLPYCIIRPCAIYGPGEKRLFKFYKMATKSVFPLLGQAECWYHLVHVDDLTNALMLSAIEEKAAGEVFIVGSSKPIRLEEMARLIADTYDHNLRIVRLPIAPFFIMGDLCEMICKPFKLEPPIYRRRVAFYSKDRYFSTRKMREVLGYKPRFENEDGIIQSARWYRDNGWL